MKKLPGILVIWIIIICLTACSSQKLTRNYKRLAVRNAPDVSKVLEVDFQAKAHKRAKTSFVPKTILDLTDKGQSAYIESFANIAKNTQVLLDNIREPISKPPTPSKPSSTIDESRLIATRDLNFFITNKLELESPGSRIENLRITITLKSNDYFESFDGIQTKYSYYEFGTVSETRARNFSLTAGLNGSNTATTNQYDPNNPGNVTNVSVIGTTPTLSGTVGGSNSITETVTPKVRTIDQTGFMSNREVNLYFEGQPGKDLNGPYSVQVSLKCIKPELPIQYVSFTKKDPDVKLEPKTVVKPDETHLPNGVLADISMEWTYRQVVRGNKHNIPGAQVTARYGQNHTFFHDQSIISPGELKLPLYYYEDSQGNVVKLKLKSGKFYALRFMSSLEAQSYLAYLIDQGKVNIGDITLVDNGGIPFRVADLGQLKLKVETI